MDDRSSTTWLRRFALVLAVALWPSTSGAQAMIAYRDGDGHWQWREPATTESFARKAEDADETVGGTFRVVYEDLSSATGVGFDDPTSGAARRGTLHAVLLYLSEVLDVPGTADLRVRASQSDGRGPLASAGPYLLPVTGFQGGLVFEHLTTGVDPLADEPDGVLTVDFGYPWSTREGGPSQFEFDLYSTLLHEITHALGFISVVGADGASALGNAGDLGVFSLFDAFLIRGSTDQPLFLEGGEIDATAQDVASGDVLFAGSRSQTAYGSFPPVFAPDPFREGSSIGHWSFATGSDAVMLPAIERGARRRQYTAWELQTLADLGYDVVPCEDDCEGEVLDPHDAGVPDAGVPDAGVPDAGGGEGTPPGSAEPPRIPPLADPSLPNEDRPTTTSSQSSAGCSIRSTGAGTVWPILLALLLTTGRRSRKAVGSGTVR